MAEWDGNMINHEWRIDIDLKTGSFNLSEGTILAFTQRGWGRPQKTSVTLVDNPAEIQTGYL